MVQEHHRRGDRPERLVRAAQAPAPASGALVDSRSAINHQDREGPPHLHSRDAVIVTFTKQKPHVTFVERGTVHHAEQTSGADRVFAFEVK
jgi:hypothetical protein